MVTSKVYICVPCEAREEVSEGEIATFTAYKVQDRSDETRVKEIAICPECFELFECVINDVIDKRDKKDGKKKSR